MRGIKLSPSTHLCDCVVCGKSFLTFSGDTSRTRCLECERRGYYSKEDMNRKLQLRVEDRQRIFLNKVDRLNSIWGVESKQGSKSKATFDHKDICTITEFDRTTEDGRLVHVEWRH